MTDTYYITTPIYYVNDRPHIGHAYTSLACDVMARYKRLNGIDVKFLTGTDEHGQKVEKSASAKGLAPKQFVDEVSETFRAIPPLMNISNDDFIRTTEPRHIRAAQALWQRMAERGYIYLDSYKGWYAVRDEAYYQESELMDGPNGKRAPSGAEVEWVEEPSYFFKLSAFQEKLLRYYTDNPDFIAPTSRRNEVMRFVEGGLKDLSISRTTFQWGVPVPGNSDHVMYVWLDALTNYLSALGFPEDTVDMQRYWPANLHIVGKDILRFHAVYWPAFLMAAELDLPKRIFAHGWWTIEGQKMSKSLGNVVSPQEMVEAYGADATRWFLMREVPFGNDGNFAREAVINRYNTELANTIGNLAQRTLAMVHKHCEGKVPNYDAFNAEELSMLYPDSLPKNYALAMDTQEFHAAAELLVRYAARANEYIDAQAPWKLRKESPEKMQHVLYILCEMIRIISIYIQPFIPESSMKIISMLNIPLDKREIQHANHQNRLTSGDVLLPPEPAFPRLLEETDTE